MKIYGQILGSKEVVEDDEIIYYLMQDTEL